MFIPIKNRDESKSGFTGTNLVLKFLCSPTPDSKFYCQFWSDFCMMAVLAFAWITTALMQWHDFVAIMCLLRLACLTACQLITFTASTITVFVSDCELICQTTWQEFKLPALLVTTGAFEMLSKWDELLVALAWLRLLCFLITQKVLTPSAIYCKKSILNAARCVSEICNRDAFIYVLAEIIQMLELEEVLRLLLCFTKTASWQLQLIVINCLHDGTLAAHPRKEKCTVFEGNLAFGGRGCGIRRTTCSTRQAVERDAPTSSPTPAVNKGAPPPPPPPLVNTDPDTPVLGPQVKDAMPMPTAAAPARQRPPRWKQITITEAFASISNVISNARRRNNSTSAHRLNKIEKVREGSADHASATACAPSTPVNATATTALDHAGATSTQELTEDSDISLETTLVNDAAEGDALTNSPTSVVHMGAPPPPPPPMTTTDTAAPTPTLSAPVSNVITVENGMVQGSPTSAAAMNMVTPPPTEDSSSDYTESSDWDEHSQEVIDVTEEEPGSDPGSDESSESETDGEVDSPSEELLYPPTDSEDNQDPTDVEDADQSDSEDDSNDDDESSTPEPTEPDPDTEDDAEDADQSDLEDDSDDDDESSTPELTEPDLDDDDDHEDANQRDVEDDSDDDEESSTPDLVEPDSDSDDDATEVDQSTTLDEEDVNANKSLMAVHSLAFGGRGCFFSNRRMQKKARIFNSTLGFPGEGPEQRQHESPNSLTSLTPR